MNANNNKKVLKKVEKGDTILNSFKGNSVRKWATEMRAMGVKKLPHLYKFVKTTPVRDSDTGKVIIEGRWEIGCYWKGRPLPLNYYIAKMGYKLPCTGTLERCDELIAEYNAALNQSGKYAEKVAKASK